MLDRGTVLVPVIYLIPPGEVMIVDWIFGGQWGIEPLASTWIMSAKPL
jgi:hypothetical protein